LGDQIKKDEMSGRWKRDILIKLRNMKRGDHVGNLGIDERVLLEGS
jgi:hypothetical protein